MALRAMKQVGLALILLLSLAAPLASGEITIEQSDHLSTYSRNVQLAFDRCELVDHVGDWLVVSDHLEGEATILPHAVLVESDLKTVRVWMDEGRIEAACPQIELDREPRWVPNDPRFGDQWHLQNTGLTSGTTGEDANLTGAWESYLGTGVMIGVVDDGVDTDHADLSTNYDDTHDWDYCGNDGNPNPTRWDAHGTAAAGVAAATGDNGQGTSGAAPDAGLAGLLLIACSTTDTRESAALNHENQVMDIYSNSWGPGDNGRTLEAPGPLMMAAFEDDVANGRGGLGNIITWAAGNGLSNDDDSNKDGYANARQTIAVTAITHHGDQSWYAEPGANILIAAHSDGDGEGITTTDIEGSDGYTNGDYTDDFGGTSSATPLVSGVIALVLEANANLTWRDVQHILVHSARQNDKNDGSWNVNGAGHDVSHKYGFGAIDAGAAVALAENWTDVDAVMNVTTGTMNVNTDIPDDTGTALTDTVTVSEALQVEHVEVVVDIDHTYRSDLEIILTSPSGTQSVLAQEHSDSGNDYSDWMFMTVHNWDESSAGNWTLSVEDVSGGDSGAWNEWELIIHGVPTEWDSDGDGLTDENETDVHGTDPDDVDTDDDGLTDHDEIVNLSTDPLDADSDDDTLSDGAEVSLYGTNPLSNDTDGDGLTDPQEILFYGSDPTVFDPDVDADGWYHFQDCNDTDPNIHPGMTELLNRVDDDCDDDIDEGFAQIDSDNDGLSDLAEYYDHLTNRTNPDTDGDGLGDGDEVLTHGTDPLVPDPDADADGWYHFEDCDETNASIHPEAIEFLDGIDNDCDLQVDEDFRNQDSDGDGLQDLIEFNLFLTDPFDDDTDDDGLFDGEEVNITFTDPLVPDPDADGDGFRWFQECDDGNATIHPDASEAWDGIDNDCDESVDEGVDRLALIEVEFHRVLRHWNATAEQMHVRVDAATPLPLDITWTLNGTSVGQGSDLMQGPWDCEGPVAGLGEMLCPLNGSVGPYRLHLVVDDGRMPVNRSFDVSWQVWHPPPPPPPAAEPSPEETEEDEDDGARELTLEGETPRLLIGALAGILVLLILIVLITGRARTPPPPPMRPPVAGLPKMTDEFFR